MMKAKRLRSAPPAARKNAVMTIPERSGRRVMVAAKTASRTTSGQSLTAKVTEEEKELDLDTIRPRWRRKERSEIGRTYETSAEII
jgi:hypothetical protein